MMGCACNRSSQLLGGLMGALDPIHIESYFELSLEMDVKCYSASGCVWALENEREIQAAINESDYASGVEVYRIAGVINPYIVIRGYSAQDFGSADHLRKGILDTITAAGYLFNAGSVRFQADTYDPTTGEPTTTRDDRPLDTTPDPNAPSWFDQLALDLGVEKQTATYLIIGGAVLAIALIAKR